jgi:hypothetical protein
MSDARSEAAGQHIGGEFEQEAETKVRVFRADSLEA